MLLLVFLIRLMEIAYYTKQALVADINKKLAGETLTFAELQLHIDSVIDDINDTLNACYPTTAEMESVYNALRFEEDFDESSLPSEYTNWCGIDIPKFTLFPMSIVRRVIIPGAALKWLVSDEEGINTANAFQEEYNNALFMLQRDFINKVPEQYKASNQGFVYDSFHDTGMTFYNPLSGQLTTNISYGLDD